MAFELFTEDTFFTKFIDDKIDKVLWP